MSEDTQRSCSKLQHPQGPTLAFVHSQQMQLQSRGMSEQQESHLRRVRKRQKLWRSKGHCAGLCVFRGEVGRRVQHRELSRGAFATFTPAGLAN